MPILEYNSEIWWNRDKKKTVESFELNYFKKILGVKLNTCNISIFSELNNYPISLHHTIKAISNWKRLRGICRRPKLNIKKWTGSETNTLVMMTSGRNNRLFWKT